jgi:HSP20 family protein
MRDLITLREAVDRMVNEGVVSRGREEGNWEGRPLRLALDAYSDEEAIMVKASVPGIDPETVEITFEKDTLTIRGELHRAEEGVNYLLRERPFGPFERTVTVNTPIDTDKIDAEFDNGELTIRLPKSEAVKPKVIEVKKK